MDIEKCLNFADVYNQKDNADVPTSYDQMYEYTGNQNNVTKGLAEAVLWQPETTYEVGMIIRHPDIPMGYVARCSASGMTGEKSPTWKIGESVKDGTTEWVLAKVMLTSDIATEAEAKAGLDAEKPITPVTLNAVLLERVDALDKEVKAIYNSLHYDVIGPPPFAMGEAEFIVGASPVQMASGTESEET